MTRRILFTTVCRPFGGVGEGHSVGAELFHYQITREQGIFSLRQVTRGWALDYLAENIQFPSVVLHYPSERELIAELKSTPYDFVGIHFVVATFHKARRLSQLVRQYAPNAKIILGGYGTVLPDELLRPFADHICKEEGIGFMRRLLGEPLDRPIAHPFAPIPSSRIYSFQRLDKVVGHITAGLGCAHGCDFCCTSHFFQRKYIPFLKTGREIYDALREMERKASQRKQDLTSLIFIDEDFFAQRTRAMEFLECIRREGKMQWLTGFGSVNSLSKYTADEIAEMGFEAIWVGYEGAQAGYGKLKGRPMADLFGELKERGILIIASMIIGYPYQTPEIVQQEFDGLMALGPSMRTSE